MNLMSSTLKEDESGKPFHVQQAEQIEEFRTAWREAGWEREPRVSVSRSLFPLVNAMDRAYFGRSGGAAPPGGGHAHQRARIGRSNPPPPARRGEPQRGDEAIAAADTLLLTVPNQLGVDYNAHVLEAVLTEVAPALGWR